MSDDLLYQKYLNGDQAAGDELMLRYGDSLTAYLDAFLHNVQDAEDLMIEACAPSDKILMPDVVVMLLTLHVCFLLPHKA